MKEGKIINKKRKEYKPIMAGISYTIGNMLIKGIPFLTLPIFTNILSTSDFGIYNIYLSYESIVSIVLGLGLSGTVRIAKIEYKNEFEEYVSAIFFFQIIVNVLCDIIILLVIKMISMNEWLTFRLQIILLCNALCSQLYNTISAKYVICGDVKKNLAMSGMMTVINISFSLLLCMYIYPSRAYIGRIYGSFLSALIIALLISIEQFKLSRKLIVRDYWKFGFRMGVPLIAHSLSLTILAQCDKIMIQSISGYDEAGIYSLASNLLGIVVVIIGSIDNAWAPWYFEKLEQNAYKDIRKVDDMMIRMFTIFCLFIMLISPELIQIMSNEQYWGSRFVFPALLVSAFFNFLYLFPVNFEYYSKMTGYIAFSTIITAILNVVLNFLFIHQMGYFGAAYATAISKFVLFLMHLRKARKIKNIILISEKTIIVCSILISGMLILTVSMINQPIVRIAAGVGVILYGAWYIKSKQLIRLLLDRNH